MAVWCSSHTLKYRYVWIAQFFLLFLELLFSKCFEMQYNALGLVALVLVKTTSR